MMRSTLSRYLVREIAAYFLGVFAIVLAVFLTRRLGMFLGDALEGSLSADVIFEVLALRTLMALPSLLPTVLYLAILLGLGRLHDDHELTALAACGISPRRIAGTVLAASGALALVIAGLALEGRPRAAERLREVEENAAAEFRIGSLRPGRFYEIGPQGRQVVFAAARGRDGAFLENVFVQIRHENGISIYRAERAFDSVNKITGHRFLEFFDGTQYELGPGEGRYEITRFGELALRTDVPADADEPRGVKVRPWVALLRSSDPQEVAELQWRLAMPTSALILALIAIPLSQTHPRRGRYTRLLLAIAIYLVYRQVLGTAKDWIAGGSLPPLPGLWGLHAVALAGAVLLFSGDAIRRRGRFGRGRRSRTPQSRSRADEAETS